MVKKTNPMLNESTNFSQKPPFNPVFCHIIFPGIIKQNIVASKKRINCVTKIITIINCNQLQITNL